MWKEKSEIIYSLHLILHWLKREKTVAGKESSWARGGNYTCGPEFHELVMSPWTRHLVLFLVCEMWWWPCSSLSFQDSTPRTTDKVPLKGGKISDSGMNLQWIMQMTPHGALPIYQPEMLWLSSLWVGRMEVGTDRSKLMLLTHLGSPLSLCLPTCL